MIFVLTIITYLSMSTETCNWIYVRGNNKGEYCTNINGLAIFTDNKAYCSTHYTSMQKKKQKIICKHLIDEGKSTQRACKKNAVEGKDGYCSIHYNKVYGIKTERKPRQVKSEVQASSSKMSLQNCKVCNRNIFGNKERCALNCGCTFHPSCLLRLLMNTPIGKKINCPKCNSLIVDLEVKEPEIKKAKPVKPRVVKQKKPKKEEEEYENIEEDVPQFNMSDIDDEEFYASSSEEEM